MRQIERRVSDLEQKSNTSGPAVYVWRFEDESREEAIARDGREFPAGTEITWILWRRAKQPGERGAMRAIERRLTRLEETRLVMPVNIRRWFGWPLSAAETAEADRLDALDAGSPDLSAASAEMRAWLGLV